MVHSKKEFFDSFQGHLYQEYFSYCNEQHCYPSINGLITYLIDKDLLSKKVIKNYTIKREFKTLYPAYQYHKTKTVMALANRFHISERSVWSSLKKQNSTPAPAPISTPTPSKAY